jgi:hypothetical protein
MVHLNPVELLRFYDEPADGNGTHSAALNATIGGDLGLGLLVHCFRGTGVTAERIGGTPTTGRKKGFWLDGWVRVDAATRPTLYQVEIKNWNAHSPEPDR